MKCFKRGLTLALLVFMMSFGHSSYAQTNGYWEKLGNNSWTYIQNGRKVRNRALTIKNLKYYFGDDGIMYSDKWLQNDEIWYYFGEDGAMYTEKWYKYKNEWYYFDDDGSMYVSRWLKYKDEWYYFNRKGEMVTDDFVTYKNNKYYFNKDGIMLRNATFNGYKIDENGVATKIESGLTKKNGKYYYIKDGKIYKDHWQLIGDKWYYFGTDGVMYTEKWYKYKGDWYYFGENGVMYTSVWLKYKDEWYYFNRMGEMVTEDFVTYKNNKYYFNKDGIMLKNATVKGYKIDKNGVATKIESGLTKKNGKYYYIKDGKTYKDHWQLIGDKWYYFGTDGVMYTEKWYKYKGDWYYFGENGVMYTSVWLKYKDEWYYFNRMGEMVTEDFVTYKNNKYYFNKDGIMLRNATVKGYKIDENGVATKVQYGFSSSNGKTYYHKDGKLVKNDWVLDNGVWYYFDKNGVMLSKNWILYKNKWYYFNKEGKMLSKTWLEYKDSWYYFGEYGAMVDGDWAFDNNKWYYLDEGGKLRTEDWIKYKNSWYYFGKYGGMYNSEWLKYKDNWYYFGSNGKMYSDQWLDYKGHQYYLQGNGKMAVNTIVDGKRINSKGHAVSHSPSTNKHFYNVKGDWKKVDGKWYFIKSNGELLKGVSAEIEERVYHFDENGVMYSNGWFQKGGRYYLAEAGGAVKTGFSRDNKGIMRYFSIVDGEMLTDLFAYNQKTEKGYNIDENGVGTLSYNPHQDFINMVKPYALRAVKGKGLFPSIAVAQAALETGYGRSTMGYPPVYNLFGIKAPKGAPESEYISVWTTEYDKNNNSYRIIDKFKKFKGYEDAFIYYSNLFTKDSWLTKYYKPVIDAKTPEEAARALTGRYATDPGYANKLMWIINKFDLKELDKEIYPNGVKP